MNSAIYNGSFLFVFVLSIIFLGERVTLGKLMGCLLCLGGLVLIAISSLSQMSSNHGSILGYAALLFSMCTWAVFSVTAEKYSTPLREVCEGVFFVGFSCFFLFFFVSPHIVDHFFSPRVMVRLRFWGCSFLVSLGLELVFWLGCFCW